MRSTSPALGGDRGEQLRRGRGAGDPAASIYNHDSAIASAARDDRHGRRPALHRDGVAADPGARRGRRGAGRVHRRFDATSNLEAGAARGADRVTAAHAFTLLHADERHAFAAQIAALGEDTTLLVDTMSVRGGPHRGRAHEGRLGAPLDLGDLALLATRYATFWTPSAPSAPRSSGPAI